MLNLLMPKGPPSPHLSIGPVHFKGCCTVFFIFNQVLLEHSVFKANSTDPESALLAYAQQKGR